MNTNYSIHTAYRPASMSAIRFNEPEKAALLDNYFGFPVPNNAVPTINLTLGVISPVITHIKKTGDYGSIGEYQAITKSCETGNPVVTHSNCSYPEINGCIFTYVADVSLNVLKNYMREPFIGSYDKTILTLEEKEKKVRDQVLIKKITEENKKLKEIVDSIAEKISANR